MCMEKTVFERIVEGKIPSWKVYEDDQVIAILDITPVNKGHVLVVPKEPFSNIYELPPELFSHLMLIVQKIAIAIKGSLHAEGMNIIMNNEKAGGHILNHAHVHVIPRYSNDGLQSWDGKELYSDGEQDLLAKKIKKNI